MEKILIIGGVAAGATAAAKARRISADAQITMLEAGPDISFANCGLPYFIGGDIENRSQLILQSPESFKDQYNVDVYTHTLVTILDRENRKVKAVDTRNGEVRYIEYTKLILAQGGRPIIPDIEGAKQEHVFTLWTMEDMDKINRYINNKEPKTAVVVGGGFIGLEMAEALVKRGLQVSVVEMMPHVMNVMEAEISAFVEQELLAYGVELYTGIGVKEIFNDVVRLENGSMLSADMVLLSIGVRPTLQLAKEAGLKLGESEGLLVSDTLQTSDPNIYAAGDMIEIEHRTCDKKVRIPLAGPANRQGRIAAENALGKKHSYKGALGTSIVRVFEAVAGTTGLSLKQARSFGIDAAAVTVHKEHHTSYYPGAQTVSVLLVYNRKDGTILGGQTAGYKSADKRLDVIAAAAASKLTIHDLADMDFSYSPPMGTANDALNMAAFTAENQLSNFSPSVAVCDLDEFIKKHKPLFIDVRDLFAFEKSHIVEANHFPLEFLLEQTKDFPHDKTILVYDETGKKGHQALRMLLGAGFKKVTNVSGGYISLQRYAASMGFENIEMELLPIESKSLDEKKEKDSKEEPQDTSQEETLSVDENSTVVVDVRTAGEFYSGAFPDSINIPLDELTHRYSELGSNTEREIIVYCASGARSSYAQILLNQLGYTNVTNGGGLMQMMMRLQG